MSASSRAEAHRNAAKVWRVVAGVALFVFGFCLVLGGGTATLIALASAVIGVLATQGAHRERLIAEQLTREAAQ